MWAGQRKAHILTYYAPCPPGLAAVDHINAVLREGDPENTLLALKKPEAQLPAVYPFAAVMYQNELFNLQKQNTSVRHGCVRVHMASQREGWPLR